MKGQSVAAVGIGEAEELVDDEDEEGVEAVEVVGVPVAVGMVEL